MKITTKIFGEIQVDDEKLLTFNEGIIGFPDLKHFMLIHDNETEKKKFISWLQSIEEPAFAMPVIDPLRIKPDYNPEVEDELLSPIGGIENTENVLVLTTVTVPSDIEKISVNLKAPIVINADTRKACQIILSDDKYLVKFPIYEIIKGNKR